MLHLNAATNHSPWAESSLRHEKQVLLQSDSTYHSNVNNYHYCFEWYRKCRGVWCIACERTGDLPIRGGFVPDIFIHTLRVTLLSDSGKPTTRIWTHECLPQWVITATGLKALKKSKTTQVLHRWQKEVARIRSVGSVWISSYRHSRNGLTKRLTHHTGPDFIIRDCEKKENLNRLQSGLWRLKG